MGRLGLVGGGGSYYLSRLVVVRFGEIGLIGRNRLREFITLFEGRRIDFYVAKKLNDVFFCYLKCCLSNFVMELSGSGLGIFRSVERV